MQAFLLIFVQTSYCLACTCCTGRVARNSNLHVSPWHAHECSGGRWLHRCLNTGNEAVIGASVRRLRPHHAAALLEAAVERLRARANRGAALTAWIRAVLLHHTAYLMAAPGVLPILASLSQVLPILHPRPVYIDRLHLRTCR